MTGPRIGFCGIGRMGDPMVRRLLAAGYEVAVWNRSAGKVAPLVGLGARKCETPAELASGVDAVLLCLGDGQAVQDVVFGQAGLAQAATPPRFVVDHSTLSPALTQSLAHRWAEATGGQWIDAPVSGGMAGAQRGTLAVIAGGPAQAIATVTPALMAFSARVTRMGEVGAGQTSKLSNQMIVATTLSALAEGFVLASRNGIDSAAMPAALQGGWADSVLLQTLWPRMVEPPEQATGTIRVLLKDLDAIAELAADSRTVLRVLPAVRGLLQTAMARGWGDEDLSQVFRICAEESAQASQPAG
ncbi:NAD(P)-dependent oxidoreductase [Bordetella holmesii]|uniref:NADP oxidoreductase coenzyme F420-dependent n=2 Tax=Bordetella holmesii TaxID=35814 RepID=A0A158M2G1_9BORD|nr:NAD(P)-dependent oxidoreductase [Bordetella holmesii]AHV93342.1 NAD binding domain of 6-phosphogluconate dehydrogenase family protein [Bordetella holmesii ATCC 51541]EWM42706.1 NAD binding domain of 6-phosphogluconate dehydrogenase family protein [Bordetella holmesii 41130]EWM46911.1 NAD binding domain of 6-phosphogluconate dehydrogenase family protein [Bordetella holmesii 35009]EWM51085.1 NAD binding domain of 6-phosphogluconate dehydrogenase family protein [Bordetella holmesii 70147]AMD45